MSHQKQKLIVLIVFCLLYQCEKIPKKIFRCSTLYKNLFLLVTSSNNVPNEKARDSPSLSRKTIPGATDKRAFIRLFGLFSQSTFRKRKIRFLPQVYNNSTRSRRIDSYGKNKGTYLIIHVHTRKTTSV